MRASFERTATHCNTQQRTATHFNTLQHCNTLQHTATRRLSWGCYPNTLQHTATHCNALHYTATHNEGAGHLVCATIEHTAAHSNTLRVLPSNTLQHTATHCNTQVITGLLPSSTLQHTATHSNTLQHAACLRMCNHRRPFCHTHTRSMTQMRNEVYSWKRDVYERSVVGKVYCWYRI